MLDKFRIYPKIDYSSFSMEFENEIDHADGIEIQFFNKSKYVENIEIKERVKSILNRYPNLREITIHPPLYNYDIEQITLKDENIVKKHLEDALELSERYGIVVHVLFHTNWNINQHIATGMIEKIKEYLKIFEGHENLMLLENLFMFEEDFCSVLEICNKIDHPNLKACIDTTHLYCKANIYKKDILEFLKDYLDKGLCEKYVYQIHFAKALNNDGYIVRETHGRAHESNETLDFDLKWMKEYNLINKRFITEISEGDYRLRDEQLREIEMLGTEIKKYM